MLGPRRRPGDGDFDDEESVAATERELAGMWLRDLDDRVGWLEELLGVAPGQMGIDERVAWLEELAEFLPEWHKLAETALVQRQHRPLY